MRMKRTYFLSLHISAFGQKPTFMPLAVSKKGSDSNVAGCATTRPGYEPVWIGREGLTGREPPQARIRMARQKPELRHLIEQPIEGICCFGP